MRASGHVVNELVPPGVNRLECESDAAIRSKRLPTRIRGRDPSDRIGVNSLSIQPDSQHAPARGGVSLLIEEPCITPAAGTKEARLRQKDHACRSCN